MASTSQVPIDVLFAQKASAIVKAAGMDPKRLDLETFRQKAHIIFGKAYIAIYKEKPSDFIDDPQHQDDYIVNAQCVIDGLSEKTMRPVLKEIAGQDLCYGSHRAIGILVGILFAEGQRLWLESMSEGGNNEGVNSSNNNHNHSSTSQPLRDQSLNVSQQKGSDFATKARRPKSASGGSQSRVKAHIKKTIAENEELEKIKSNRQSSGAKDNEDIDPLAQEAEMLRRRLKELYRQMKDSRENEEDQLDILLDEGNDNNNNNDTDEDNELKKSNSALRVGRLRPNSAPVVRKKVTKVSDRLYTVPGPLAATDHTANKTWITNDNNNNNVRHDGKAPAPVNPFITYDMKSGRRIELTKEQYEAQTRAMIARQQNTKVTEADEMREQQEKQEQQEKRASSPPHSPTKPAWPGNSTGRSTEEWIRKNRMLATVNTHTVTNTNANANANTNTMAAKPFVVGPVQHQDYEDSGALAAYFAADKERVHQYTTARFFKSYSDMQLFDLVISVEHCFHCEHHNVSLRHNPTEYVQNADNVLRILVQAAYSSNVCARVGVVRFRANITPKSKQSDVDTRIGAFEVQVAYRDAQGNIVPEVIHSKLATRRWPAKSVIEKRFQAYLSKVSVRMHASVFDEDFSSANAPPVVWKYEGSGGSYPVGLTKWEDIQFCDPGWTYPLHSTLNNDHGPLQFMCWAFDTRVLSRYEVGAVVRVKVGPSKQSKGLPLNGERHPLLGTVMGIEESTRELIVQMRYFDEKDPQFTIQVSESDCLPAENYECPEILVCETVHQMPLPLQLLCLAIHQSSYRCQLVSNEEEGVMLLPKPESYFHQARTIARFLESQSALNLFESDGSGLIRHPKTGELVDLQLAYSEPVLKYVSNLRDVGLTIDALYQMAAEGLMETAYVTDGSAVTAPFTLQQQSNAKMELVNVKIVPSQHAFTTLQFDLHHKVTAGLFVDGYQPMLFAALPTTEVEVDAEEGSTSALTSKQRDIKCVMEAPVCLPAVEIPVDSPVCLIQTREPHSEQEQSQENVKVTKCTLRMATVCDEAYSIQRNDGVLETGVTRDRIRPSIPALVAEAVIKIVAEDEDSVPLSHLRQYPHSQTAKFETGQDALVNYQGLGAWYLGTVRGFQSTKRMYDVNILTADRQRIYRTIAVDEYARIRLVKRLHASPYPVGTLVEIEGTTRIVDSTDNANYDNNGNNKLAKILAHTGDLLYDVVYENGDEASGVSHEVMRDVHKMREYSMAVKAIRAALLDRVGGDSTSAARRSKELFEGLAVNNELKTTDLRAFLESRDLSSLLDSKFVDLEQFYNLITEQIDIDKSGTVSLTELYKFLWPENPNDRELAVLLEICRTSIIARTGITVWQSEDQMFSLFAKIFKIHLRKPGFLMNVYKLRPVFSLFGQMTHTEVNSVIQSIDTNQDTVVSPQEFKAWLFPSSLSPSVPGDSDIALAALGGEGSLTFVEGDEIEVDMSISRWVRGVVARSYEVSCDPFYTILYESGDGDTVLQSNAVSWMTRFAEVADIRDISPGTGSGTSGVMANHNGDGVWFPAEVTSDNDNGTFQVHYPAVVYRELPLETETEGDFNDKGPLVVGTAVTVCTAPGQWAPGVVSESLGPTCQCDVEEDRSGDMHFGVLPSQLLTQDGCAVVFLNGKLCAYKGFQVMLHSGFHTLGPFDMKYPQFKVEANGLFSVSADLRPTFAQGTSSVICTGRLTIDNPQPSS